MDGKTENLLQMEQISKSFGSVRALHEVNLELSHGEVLGLVGDNGAGKSTLIKILSGAINADEGRIFFNGKEVRIENPQDARNHGIETIYQTFALVGNLPIYLNIFLGRYRLKPILGGLIRILDEKKMEKESWEILRNLKIHFNSVREKVDHLSGGQRQAVAIGRALFFNPRMIIMDEPTSGLAVKEVEQIHDIIREFKKKGVSIIFITHRLQSIFGVADRVVVLRNGQNAMDKKIAETTLEEVVRAMFGLHVKIT
ncbi:MAG: ATP-binding cassette domain-containing protein [Desulfobacterales bacterium]|nr:ATP-binding cassette domain-containing protein [Desulfobacterales bacterium]